MRAVIQRVSEARVSVEGQTHAEIGPGLVVLVGVEGGDTEADAGTLAQKILDLRIFGDEQGRMNRSITDVGGSVLAVSQFTLLGDCRKGRRPSFVRAAAPGRARELYDEFVGALTSSGVTTATGVFQADMEVALKNQGPVTLLLDTRKVF